MQARNLFSKLGRRLEESIASKKTSQAARIWAEFCTNLDDLFADLKEGSERDQEDNTPVATNSNPVPQQIRNLQALTAQSPIFSPASIAGIGTNNFDEDSGYPLRIAVIASGEGIEPGHAINVKNGVARLATATDNDLQCNGVAVRGTGQPDQIYYRCGGTVFGQLAQPITNGGRLWLSVTPGKFTDIDNEVGKVIHQDCAQYHELLPGMTNFAVMSFQYSPEANLE